MTTHRATEAEPAIMEELDTIPPVATAASAEPTERVAGGYPAEVKIIDLFDRRYILVGTAHVSRRSVDLVRRVIETEKPDRVCIELDPQRYAALEKEKKWEELDLKEIIRQKQLPTLLMNLLLASYQKRLGGKLGVMPGQELLEAARVAQELGVPIELCDRDVRVTLRRAAAVTTPIRKFQLLVELMVTMLSGPEISEEDLEKLKEHDVLSELLDDLGRHLPSLKKVLIDERDAYLAEKMRRAPGERIVAVVGAGHLRGICEALSDRQRVDLDALSAVPPSSPVWKIAGWGLPLMILSALFYIGWTKGPEQAGEDILFWVVINSIPTALGAIIALAHPLTILTALVVAPFTSLTPIIGAGYVTAFVQAYVQPPVVRELSAVADDLMIPRMWWRNRLLRIFLAFLLPTIGSIFGSLVGGGKIFSSLF